MNQAETARLAQMMAMLAAYYRVKLEDAVLRMYAKDLADLDFDSVCSSLEAYRRDPKNKFMPLPAAIREMLTPNHESDDAKAREIAAKINSAVIKFGWTCPNEAKEFVGEIGWEVVRLNGGWNHICSNLGVSLDMNQFIAQARELAKALLAKQPRIQARHLAIAPSELPRLIEGEHAQHGEITIERLRELMRDAGLIKPEQEHA